jgi:hypothetical protein
VVGFDTDWDNAPIVAFDKNQAHPVTLPAEEFATYQVDGFSCMHTFWTGMCKLEMR